jgi:hypothetical protein
MTKALKFRMHPQHVLQADQLLKSSLYPIMLAGEPKWSGWWIYAAGWSDERIAAMISPRLSADNIADIREATKRGRLWGQTTTKDD